MTLLDLKNAFGEVHHNLIKSVLSYHHIPSHVKAPISRLDLDLKTSIITEEFQTLLSFKGEWQTGDFQILEIFKRNIMQNCYCKFRIIIHISLSHFVYSWV